MLDVPRAPDADTHTVEIAVSLGIVPICNAPIEIQVRRIVPLPGDVMVRKWVDGEKEKSISIQPFALVRIHETAQYFANYVEEHFLDNNMAVSTLDRLVREGYLRVRSHYQDLLASLAQPPTLPARPDRVC